MYFYYLSESTKSLKRYSRRNQNFHTVQYISNYHFISNYYYYYVLNDKLSNYLLLYL